MQSTHSRAALGMQWSLKLMKALQRGSPGMTTEKGPIRDQLVIIETDDLIRDLLTRWLTEAGYRVHTNDSPSATTALVIADVPNPAQADGALRELSARYGAPILAISGRFRRDPVASEDVARRLRVAKVLPKPFTCEELLAAVAQCLDGR
jgi:DNA-binding response OmpR family regulator